MTAATTMTERAPVRTTCPYCGVGCGVLVSRDAGGGIGVAGDPEHGANLGRLCSKGSALAQTIGQEGRLLEPAVRGRTVDWDTALDAVGRGLGDIIREHGPGAVAFYVSGQFLSEDYYVANKLMKGFIGAANIDTNSRLCMSSAVMGHKRAFGRDTVANCYQDLELAELVVLAGSNAAWCHPVLYQRMRAAAERHGGRQRIVVIDPRRTASCDDAWLHLAIRPGTDPVLFNGLLVYLAARGHLDSDYIAAHTEGFEDALRAARAQAADVVTVAAHCGLPVADVERFYQAFAGTDRTLSLFSQGINQSSHGTDNVNSIINCHLACGRIGREGSGAFSITGQPNAMGGREVGGLANTLAAHMEFEPDDIERVGRFWRATRMAQRPGLKAVDLFAAIERGEVRAVWIMATNPVVSLPEADRVRAALDRCELVIVSDCNRDTDTTRHADILLPAATWGEKDGTVTNSERRISRQRAFLEPPGMARPDWWILTQVARRMGYGAAFAYESAADIFREHAALSGFENQGERDFDISALQDLSDAEYDGLSPRQWPIRDAATDSSARLMGDGSFFTVSGKARFVAVDPAIAGSRPCPDYPLLLNSGRVRDHWHTLTRTGKSPRLSRHTIEPFAQIHPRTAAGHGIDAGDLVEVSSANGSVLVRAHLDEGQREDSVFIPFHWNDRFAACARVDSLVFAHADPLSGQPEFKYTPVRLRRRDFAWHGFLLCRGSPRAPCTDYWARAIEEGFWRFELAASRRPDDWREWLVPFAGGPGDAQDWLSYEDPVAGRYRTAWFDQGRLRGCLFVAPTPAGLPPRDWLLGQFGRESFSARERIRLLAGCPADPGADPGPVVCSCFNVGRNTIVEAISGQGLDSVDAIGHCLKAGSNCGSCRPELKTLLASTQARGLACSSSG